MYLQIQRRGFIAGALGAMLASTRLGTDAISAQSHLSVLQLQQSPDWQGVSQALGAVGQLMDGEVFRVGMPRSDLQVTVRDIPLKPSFALGSYAAFKQIGSTPAETIVMGDLVLLDTELNDVMSGLFTAGFSVSGVHNHLNELTPHVMYMHYMGMGEPVVLAEGLAQALSASATPRKDLPTGTPQPSATPSTDLPTAQIEEALGHQARVVTGGVVQISIPRAETIMEGDVELLPSMGVA